MPKDNGNHNNNGTIKGEATHSDLIIRKTQEDDLYLPDRTEYDMWDGGVFV